MSLIDKLIPGRRPPTTPADGPAALDPMVARLLEEGTWVEETARLREPEMLAAIRERTREEQRAAAFRIYLTLERRTQDRQHMSLWSMRERPALVALTRRKLGWKPDETRVLWQVLAARADSKAWRYSYGEAIKLPLAAAEEVRAQDPAALPDLEPTLRSLLLRLDEPTGWWDAADRTRTRRRLTDLLPASSGSGRDELSAAILGPGDAFGQKIRAELLADVDAEVVVPFLTHLVGYSGGVTPTKTWRTKLHTLLVESPARGAIAVRLLERVTDHEATVASRGTSGWTEWVFVTPETALVLRASVWAARDSLMGPADEPAGGTFADGDAVVAVLAAAAIRCAGGLGGAAGEPRCSQVTSSAIAALADIDQSSEQPAGMGGDVVVAALARIHDKLRNRTLVKAADKALATVAARSGITPGQLLERSVPTFGLGRDGLTQELGDHTATIAVTDAGVRLGWTSATGRTVRSVPKAVREQHAEDLAQLRIVAKEAQKVLSSERARLEDLLATDRTWPGPEWIRLYAEHPITGVHTTHLLWEVTARDDEGRGPAWAAGLPVADGDRWALRAADGTLSRIGESDTIRLWHPIRATEDQVASWRGFVQDSALRQPFKQVFREVYRLTPAEEATDTYSNRYAAHILRYRQAGALMRGRGWVGNHLGYWDGGFEGEATREFPDSGWRASFYYDLVENAEDGYETPSYCASDQVRFTRRTVNAAGHDQWERARMNEVPVLVLTEAMRDVDLFVGVTSIAADPQWIDRGEERYRDYWHTTSFGELTESAQVRREALARLMPRTRIADRVRLTERFLEVDGTRRTYKIHLGSGNILMSPNDTYLCIVVDRGTGTGTGQVFLPFEEDGGLLSVIVSKAFLLAADDEITDRTILAQLAST